MKVVIIGAGIVGCAVADELAARGVADVTLIERGPWPRPGGSTSHAPGLVFQTNGSETMTRFASHTLARLDGLSGVDGQPCAWRVGSLEVATTPDRLDELARRWGWATGRGLDAELLEPVEAAALHPLLEPGRILGALHVPSDAWVRPHHTAAALVARSGAVVVADTVVTAVESSAGAVRGVVTDRGRYPADVVVCCAGIWGPLVGALAGVTIPLQPMAHQYALTGPVPALAARTADDARTGAEVRHPLLRHQGAGLYFREHGDRLGVGSYAHRPMPVEPGAIGTGTVGMPSVLPFTPDDFVASWADAVDLLPDLAGHGPVEGINGLFSFTPDGAPLLGPAPELDGFWVAEAIWITHSIGAARAVAEGICGQAPTLDLHDCDPGRFEPAMTTPASVRPQAVARFVEVYDAVHPLQPPTEPRPLRVSPFFAREVALGAEMLVGNGWERPQWYGANRDLAADRGPAAGGPGAGGPGAGGPGAGGPGAGGPGAGGPGAVGRAAGGPADGDGPGRRRQGWAARHWSPVVTAEHLAARARVGLYDMTSLRRLEVSGPGALGLLDHLTTTRMDKRPGSVSYTLMLDGHGGIRSDITVARLDDERFWVGTNGAQDQAWITGQARGQGAPVEVRDVTGSVCCLGLWGPAAAAVISPLVDADVDFPYFSLRHLHVGEVPVTALRVSYVGEYGWELCTTADYGQRLWDLLARAGADHGLLPVGRGALEGMRLEKGYRAWGRDMSAVDSPDEAGLGWAVNRALDFVGRAALDDRPVTRRLRTLTLDDPDRVVLGGETVRAAGRPVGSVTSAAYGASVGRGIAYAWLPPDLAEVGTAVEIGWFSEQLAAHVVDDTLWDPDGLRVRRPPAPSAGSTSSGAPTPAAPASLSAAVRPDVMAGGGAR
jgi:glycine cleavage system aminomethyltransferase T/glycine/D-amino acid oxidase-like deaminating enzyme